MEEDQNARQYDHINLPNVLIVQSQNAPPLFGQPSFTHPPAISRIVTAPPAPQPAAFGQYTASQAPQPTQPGAFGQYTGPRPTLGGNAGLPVASGSNTGFSAASGSNTRLPAASTGNTRLPDASGQYIGQPATTILSPAPVRVTTRAPFPA